MIGPWVPQGDGWDRAEPPMNQHPDYPGPKRYFWRYKSKRSFCTLFGYYAMYAIGSAFACTAILSIFAVNSLGSLMAVNSFFSFMSCNSVLSVFSLNCFMCVGCINSFMEICLD